MKYTAAKKQGHRTVTVILIILAVLLAAAAILSWMVLNDPNAGKGLENVKPTETLAADAAKSALTGKESSISVDEVNGYLAYLFQGSNLSKKGGSVKLQAVALSNASGNSTDLYLPVLYHGKHLGVVLNLTPSLDTANNRFLFQVNSARVGGLPVPVSWVLDAGKSRLPESFTVTGNTISCESPSIQASISGISASLKVNDFHMDNGLLKIGSKAEIKVG